MNSLVDNDLDFMGNMFSLHTAYENISEVYSTIDCVVELYDEVLTLVKPYLDKFEYFLELFEYINDFDDILASSFINLMKVQEKTFTLCA